jgi:hypothetical protein
MPDMNVNAEIAVTLSPELWQHLAREARRLRIPFEWLVAGIVADTMGDAKQAGATAA